MDYKQVSKEITGIQTNAKASQTECTDIKQNMYPNASADRQGDIRYENHELCSVGMTTFI
jgi:hypothetical protein